MNGNRAQQIAFDRANADQGDFFFANIRLSDGNIYPRPVFVVGMHNDSNDVEDIIVCSCTKVTSRVSEYDIPVNLKLPTAVRTNKIYTTNRSALDFKITHNVDPVKIQELITKCVEAISPK